MVNRYIIDYKGIKIIDKLVSGWLWIDGVSMLIANKLL